MVCAMCRQTNGLERYSEVCATTKSESPTTPGMLLIQFMIGCRTIPSGLKYLKHERNHHLAIPLPQIPRLLLIRSFHPVFHQTFRSIPKKSQCVPLSSPSS